MLKRVNEVVVASEKKLRRGWHMDLQRVPPDNHEDIIWTFYVGTAGAREVNSLHGTTRMPLPCDEIPIAIVVGSGRTWRVRTLPPKGRKVQPFDCAIDLHGVDCDDAKLEAEIMLRTNDYGPELDFTTASAAPAQAHAP